MAEPVIVKPDHVRVLQLGPFTATVDQGIPLRKAALQAFSAILRVLPDILLPEDLIPIFKSTLVDPSSEVKSAQTEATQRYYKDEAVQDLIAHTHKLSEVEAADYDAVFYPGGHGPLWDLANDVDSQKLILDFYNAVR